MKTTILATVLAFTCLPAFGDDAAVNYQKGLDAIKRNDVDAAQQAFKETLRINPNHPYARYQIGRLQQEAPMLRAKKREAELASVRLPEVNFDEAPFADALSALNAMIEAESEKTLGKDKALVPNLNVQDSTGQLGQKEVTLQLKNVPAHTVLKYMLEQVGARVRYDEHATVVTPN